MFGDGGSSWRCSSSDGRFHREGCVYTSTTGSVSRGADSRQFRRSKDLRGVARAFCPVVQHRCIVDEAQRRGGVLSGSGRRGGCSHGGDRAGVGDPSEDAEGDVELNRRTTKTEYLIARSLVDVERLPERKRSKVSVRLIAELRPPGWRSNHDARIRNRYESYCDIARLDACRNLPGCRAEITGVGGSGDVFTQQAAASYEDLLCA